MALPSHTASILLAGAVQGASFALVALAAPATYAVPCLSFDLVVAGAVAAVAARELNQARELRGGPAL